MKRLFEYQLEVNKGIINRSGAFGKVVVSSVSPSSEQNQNKHKINIKNKPERLTKKGAQVNVNSMMALKHEAFLRYFSSFFLILIILLRKGSSHAYNFST